MVLTSPVLEGLRASGTGVFFLRGRHEDKTTTEEDDELEAVGMGRGSGGVRGHVLVPQES